jgi:tetratricopeptide (TPR) repeat protein
MFKRLLQSLTGKKTSAGPATVTRPVKANVLGEPGPELITVYDVHGREMQIPRAEWLEKVLKPELRAKWDQPDSLYQLIISALNDGFAIHLDEASARLLAIDPNMERGHVVRGIVLLKLDRLDEAERALRAATAKLGETGTLLTNLAKVQVAKGNSARADATLWKAITLDPNQDNGLAWWVARERERGGEAAYVAALEKVAALPGSWRAALWLGRQQLKDGDVAGAIDRFRRVLAHGAYDPDTLITISGDLGNAGHIAEFVELVAPHYDPAVHAPQAGLNLLQAYLRLDRLDEAEALLDRLYALKMPPFKQYLDDMAKELQDRRREVTPARPVEENALKVGQVPFELPIWMYGLRDPDWLLAHKPADARKVLFLMLGKVVQGAKQAEEQREDDVGRLSRAIPLYLAESAYEWTPLHAQSLVAVVMDGGPVVFGAQDEASERETALKLAELAELVVQGSIDDAGERWKVVLSLRETATGQAIAHEALETDKNGIEAGVLDLEARLLGHLGGARANPHDRLYARPSLEQMQPYLNALAQSLMLCLVANQVVPKGAMWGERNMLEWPLRMALQWPGLEVAKAMYLSGISHAARYHSDVLEEFEERSFALLRDMRAQSSPTAELGPLLLHAFRRKDGIAAARRAIRDMRQQAWLDRVTS